MNRALMTVLIVSAPALVVAIIIGIAVGLFQALTQIQDQTLPQAVKLIAVMLVVIFLGSLMAVQVGNLTGRMLDIFPEVTR
ncbi:EscS/YscS/HrcS family type III secretion system export apparatus protein [Paracoccus onubensis]|nr:flagellar biosynthetic protein FliQ [Paracoccus onubensis]